MLRLTFILLLNSHLFGGTPWEIQTNNFKRCYINDDNAPCFENVSSARILLSYDRIEVHINNEILYFPILEEIVTSDDQGLCYRVIDLDGTAVYLYKTDDRINFKHDLDAQIYQSYY